MPAIGCSKADKVTAAPLAGETARTRILLVDDDDVVRESVGSMLDFLGFEPVLAATGEEALALLGEGLRPSLAILDMDMPGLGGAGTLPRLRDLCPDLPVLIVTGRVTELVHHLIRQFPGVSLLPKPFNLAGLRDRLP
jgi:CheY-like chemotaxis protein